MSHNVIVSIRNLSVSYDNIEALSDVNLDIYEDDFVGIIGPNGGGKSTLVKAIMGSLNHKGEISLPILFIRDVRCVLVICHRSLTSTLASRYPF